MKSFWLTLLGLTCLFYLLVIGKALLVPLVFALLLWFALISLAGAFERFGLPSWASILCSFSVYGLVLWGVYAIIDTNAQQIIQLAPEYEERVRSIVSTMAGRYIDDTSSFDLVGDFFSNIQLSRYLGMFATGLLGLFSNMGVVFIYVLFLLLEYKNFDDKIVMAFPQYTKRKKIMGVIARIQSDVASYFTMKTFVSFLTGLLSYLVLVSFGVDFALFWGFLIFLLNFIPTLGSIVSILFPIALSFVQFENGWMVLGVTIGLAAVQIVIGNIIDPKLTGNRLNLSPLVLLVALAFWGAIWGVVGMVLSVPIMVILNIILSEFDHTRPLAVFLSERGRLQK